jgi:hypothetical protein
MDRIEEKIENTLKMLAQDPPDTLVNQVMAKVRTSKKKPNMLWVGIASTLACAVVITVMVTTNGMGIFKNQVPAPMESMDTAQNESTDTYAAKAAPPGKGDDSSAGLTSSAPSDKDSSSQRASDKQKTSQKIPESKPATKEEIDQLKKPIGETLESISDTLPKVVLTSKEKNPEIAWRTVRDKSMAYTTIINNEIIGDKKLPSSKKTYKLSVVLSRSYYQEWTKMVKKNAPNISGSLTIPTQGNNFNITITFEPIK